MKKDTKIVIGLLAALGAVVALIFLRRKKSAPGVINPAPAPEKEVDPTIVEDPYISDPNPVKLDPIFPQDPDPRPIEVKPLAPQPLEPKETPEKGQFYAVKKGDTMLGICSRAGFVQRAERRQAYRAMLVHNRNQWIGRKVDRFGDEVLRFNQRFAAVSGFEDKPWAWGTDYVAGQKGKWPVVYVPTDGELNP